MYSVLYISSFTPAPYQRVLSLPVSSLPQLPAAVFLFSPPPVHASPGYVTYGHLTTLLRWPSDPESKTSCDRLWVGNVCLNASAFISITSTKHGKRFMKKASLAQITTFPMCITKYLTHTSDFKRIVPRQVQTRRSVQLFCFLNLLASEILGTRPDFFLFSHITMLFKSTQRFQLWFSTNLVAHRFKPN